MPKTPSYRQRSGYSQAIVTLTDSVTGQRRDYWLGEFGSAPSREAYHRIIAQWEAASRRLPEYAPATASMADSTSVVSERPELDPLISRRAARVARAAASHPPSPTIAELMLAYWRWAEGYYRPNESGTLRVVLRMLRRYHGSEPAVQFGPSKLRALRDVMIRGEPVGDSSGESARKPWTRGYTNQQVRRIRAMFKWGASHERLPVSVYQALCTMEPLKRGRTEAREGKRIAPAPMELVGACRPHLNRQLRAILDLQLLTGARCGEIVIMRPVDIDTSRPDGTWVYRPSAHKNEHRRLDRTIFLGPKAQEILMPFLSGRRLDAFMFSPREADAERRAALTARRKTPLSCGNRVGSNRKERPERVRGERYSSNSYYIGVQKACDAAWPLPSHLARLEVSPGRLETLQAYAKRLTPAERAQIKTFRASKRFHPHQLRHTAATLIRQQFGLEAAQLVLGHSSAMVTDAVYAERDASKIAEVIRRVG